MARLSRVVLDNFLSFGHVEFDLCGKDGARSYAFVYGENGSGKTNLVSSLDFLHDSIGTISNADALDSFRAELDRKGPPQFPDDPEKQDLENAVYYLARFNLGMGPTSLMTMASSCRLAGSKDPMNLRYEFDIDGTSVSYEITFDENGMLTREELARFTKGTRTSRVYLVVASDDGPVASFGRSVFAAELSRILRRRIPPSWGRNSLMAILLSEFLRNNAQFMETSVTPLVVRSMRFVSNLSVDIGRESGLESWPNGMPVEHGFMKPEDRKILEAYERAASSYLVRLYSDIKKAEYETRMKDGALEYRLVLEKVIAGERRKIPIDRESSGTRKLLGMLPALLRCVSGGVALIDEFDSGVHDKIVHDVLEEIRPQISGQLILTTHNTLLLETAEPSNVYVIRTSVDGHKEIRTFDSIAHTKRGHNNNRIRYLQGLYDGVPIIRKLDLPLIVSRLEKDLKETS